MSKFTTHISTEVKTTIASLPKGSFIHAVTLNPETNDICIMWEDTRFESGLTVPVEFPTSDIKRKTLPEGVYKAGKKPVATLTPPQPENVPTAQPEPNNTPSKPQSLTEDEVKTALGKGEQVEYQGINPIWRPLSETDIYINGYFYRLKPAEEKKAVDVVSK